jgi:hypothetical protein
MTQNIQVCVLTHWVNANTLHGFSKNPSMPGLRYRSWQECRRRTGGNPLCYFIIAIRQQFNTPRHLPGFDLQVYSFWAFEDKGAKLI